MTGSASLLSLLSLVPALSPTALELCQISLTSAQSQPCLALPPLPVIVPYPPTPTPPHLHHCCLRIFSFSAVPTSFLVTRDQEQLPLPGSRSLETVIFKPTSRALT